MPKQINCYLCKVYLGEIKDARLRKDTLFICEKCSKPRPKTKDDDETVDMLKGFFGMK